MVVFSVVDAVIVADDRLGAGRPWCDPTDAHPGPENRRFGIRRRLHCGRRGYLSVTGEPYGTPKERGGVTMKTSTEVWTYDTTLNQDHPSWVGYDVHATDGDIGKIDEMSVDSGSASIIVDTGFWIFGKRRLLPAACVRSVDHQDKTVHVSLNKDQIKHAPDFDALQRRDRTFYDDFGGYYGPLL